MVQKKHSNSGWQFLISFLNTSSFSVVIADAKAPDYPVVFVNTAFENMTGYSYDETIGRNCRFLQSSDRHQSGIALITTAINNGQECKCVLRNYRKDGTMFWNKLHLFPFRENGEMTYIVGTQQEVSVDRLVPDSMHEIAADRAKLVEELEKKQRRTTQLSLDLVNAQEAERKALARELHDEFGQRLCALKMLLDRSQTYFHGNKAEQIWSRAEQELTELIALVRHRSASLRPPGLDHFGLEATVRDLVTRQLDGGPAWHFDYINLPERLAPAVEITAFRIVQESLTNIVRHSQASQVEVRMSSISHGNELEVTVYDNGAGFDSSERHEVQPFAAGQGIIGMSERVHLLGGLFNIRSEPNSGTKIIACIPL